MIEGVVIKKLVSHIDERGFFREIFRFSDEFEKVSVGQLSHSLVNEGVVKAWHAHKVQAQWNYVVSGLIKVALYDNRPNSSTYKEIMQFIVGDVDKPIAYFFPPRVLHGYLCLKGPMQIIYVTSGVFDSEDEIRISKEELNIGFEWIKS